LYLALYNQPEGPIFHWLIDDIERSL